MKKLVVVLLTGAMCLLLGTSSLLAAKYNEAPMLKTMVAAGELPAVEERLPLEPFVEESLEGIGKYGGTLYDFTMDPNGYGDTMRTRSLAAFRQNADMSGAIPFLLKGWEFSEDTKILTLYQRRGIKWSDGTPFTADDIIFWWEDDVLNEELNPSGYWWAAPSITKIEKVDDWTTKWYFEKSTAYLINLLSFAVPAQNFFHPKHYVKKWHIKYNAKADELAKEEGFETWMQAFRQHAEPHQWYDLDSPTIGIWVPKKKTVTSLIVERNPYFWAVDAAGNQLPYIDRVVTEIVESPEVITLKALAGEMSWRMATLDQYPLYMKNAKRGDYRVLLYKSVAISAAAYAINQTVEDPVLRKIFRDIRFRRALSLAINREEINNMVFFGKGTPIQVTAFPSSSYYEEKWGKNYAEYDPEEANRLLDEMGLKWDKKRQYRLRPDGERLALTVDGISAEWAAISHPPNELVTAYWEAIGVEVTVQLRDWNLHRARVLGNDFDVSLREQDETTEIFSWALPRRIISTYNSHWAPLWDDWMMEKETGEEPPEVVKKLYETVKIWQATLDKEEYARLAKELWNIHYDNLWVIGTVGLIPVPIVVQNNLKGFSPQGYWGTDTGVPNTVHATQWYFED